MKKYSSFLSEIFQFLEVTFFKDIYLNRLVFVMTREKTFVTLFTSLHINSF